MLQCPGNECLRTERHHAVGRVMAKAIANGRKGGLLVMADVGSTDSHAGNRPYDSSLPPWLVKDLEDQHPGIQAARKYRPDILLIERPSGPGTIWEPGMEVFIGELKVCQDTRPEDAWHRAQEQHKEFAAALQAVCKRHHYHLTVTIVPVLVGAAGTVYQEYTLDSLKTLGVVDELHDTVRKMRNLAVVWSHTIKIDHLRCATATAG